MHKTPDAMLEDHTMPLAPTSPGFQYLSHCPVLDFRPQILEPRGSKDGTGQLPMRSLKITGFMPTFQPAPSPIPQVALPLELRATKDTVQAVALPKQNCNASCRTSWLPYGAPLMRITTPSFPTFGPTRPAPRTLSSSCDPPSPCAVSCPSGPGRPRRP